MEHKRSAMGGGVALRFKKGVKKAGAWKVVRPCVVNSFAQTPLRRGISFMGMSALGCGRLGQDNKLATVYGFTTLGGKEIARVGVAIS